MLRSPSISFLVVIILINSVISSVNDQFLQPSSSVKEEVVLRLINTTQRFETNKSIIAKCENGAEERVCFRNRSSCQKDTDYTQVLKQLIKYAHTPSTFDLSGTDDVNTKCKLQSLQYHRALDRFEMWALKMYDSNAKISSGLLNGNVNQLGDFDLCLSVNEESLQIKGQYCLASLQVKTPQNRYLKSIHQLLHSHYMLNSKLHDPGHRVPRFSSINWALCVPNSCSASDVHLALQKSINIIFNGTNLEVDVLVDPIMCQTLDSKPPSWPTYFVGNWVRFKRLQLGAFNNRNAEKRNVKPDQRYCKSTHKLDHNEKLYCVINLNNLCNYIRTKY